MTHRIYYTEPSVTEFDAAVTMGCGDACPVFPGKRYEDWQVDDPAGQGTDAVRVIRDAIDSRVQVLVADLLDHRLPPLASG